MFSIVNSRGIKFEKIVRILCHKGVQPYRLNVPVLNSVFNSSASNPVCPPPTKKGCSSPPICPPPKSGGGKSGSCSGLKGPGPGSGKHKYTYKPYVRPCPQDHDQKNMSLNRPMSPHLTVFAMTTPAAMSVMQRATGCLLASYAILLAGGTLFLSNGVETYVSMIQSLDLGRFSTFIIKLMLGAPFAYHYFNGIRFCMWNAGRWLAMTEVETTAKRAIIGAAVLAVFFALL